MRGGIGVQRDLRGHASVLHRAAQEEDNESLEVAKANPVPMSWHRLSTTLLRMLFVSALLSLPVGAADVTLRGRVVDENEAPVRAARVIVRPAAVSAASASERPPEAETDPAGAFSFTLSGPGDFLVSVERQGYYALKDTFTITAYTQAASTFRTFRLCREGSGWGIAPAN